VNQFTFISTNLDLKLESTAARVKLIKRSETLRLLSGTTFLLPVRKKCNQELSTLEPETLSAMAR